MSPLPSTRRSRVADISDRQKKWAPKVRTGCHTCRQRRVKCDERKPNCRRCVNLKVECHYSLAPAARPPFTGMLPAAAVSLVHQPADAVFPAGVESTGYELEMFAVFRSETVHNISGIFNRDFWATDVPRAAQAYPAVWHASLALAAVQQRIRARGDEHGSSEADANSPAMAISRRHYVFALGQYNKSIACMGERLKEANPLAYGDKEMVLLANVLYIAICNILDDTKQVISHVKNVIGLIGQLRFGEELTGQNSSQGVLRYPELLAVLAFIDGQSADFDEIANRFERDYAISMPTYNSFNSMTEVYLAFLVILYDGLKPINYANEYTDQARISILTGKLEDYKIRLSDYEYRRLKTGLLTADVRCIAEIRLYLRYFDIYFSAWASTTRTDFIGAETQYEDLLKDIDKALEERHGEAAKLKRHQELGQQEEEALPTLRTHVHSFSFSVSPSTMLHEIARVAFTSQVRFTTQGLMKKYPFKEGAMDSEFLVARYEAFTAFMLRGPERTLPIQRRGCPAKRWHTDTATGPDGDAFDGCQGCECVEGVFICQDHRVQFFAVETINDEQFCRVQSRYDRRYGLEGEVFEYITRPPLGID